MMMFNTSINHSLIKIKKEKRYKNTESINKSNLNEVFKTTIVNQTNATIETVTPITKYQHQNSQAPMLLNTWVS